jgi:hypothetical protein
MSYEELRFCQARFHSIWHRLLVAGCSPAEPASYSGVQKEYNKI